MQRREHELADAQPKTSSSLESSDKAPHPGLPSKSPAAKAIGALAVGAVAIGALAIGVLAIGRIVVGRARIRRVEVDDLVIRRLHITEKLEAPNKSGEEE